MLALLCISGRARAQEPSAQAPQAHRALSPEDYARRASQALQQGNALLAGQILMLSYQDHAEIEALYVAGIAFERAGRTDLAITAWSIFICKSDDTIRVDALRDRLRSKKTAQPCSDATHTPATERSAPPSAQGYFQATTEREEVSLQGESTGQDLQWNFEFETGIRMGEAESYALTWAPGLWFGHDSKFRFGLFIPLLLGDNQASAGLEARTRVGLQPGINGEVSFGLHQVEHFADTSTSFGAAINFRDALTVGLKRQSFGRATDYIGGDYSANFLDATFTGKTGITITAIEAVLALLVFGLASGSGN